MVSRKEGGELLRGMASDVGVSWDILLWGGEFLWNRRRRVRVDRRGKLGFGDELMLYDDVDVDICVLELEKGGRDGCFLV